MTEEHRNTPRFTQDFVSYILNYKPPFMLQRSALYLALLVVVIVGACSVLKKEDPAQSVRTFLSSFHSNLNKPDQEILKRVVVIINKHNGAASVKLFPSLQVSLLYRGGQSAEAVRDALYPRPT